MKYIFYIYNGEPTRECRPVSFAGEGIEIEDIDFSSDTDAALYALDIIASNNGDEEIIDVLNTRDEAFEYLDSIDISNGDWACLAIENPDGFIYGDSDLVDIFFQNADNEYDEGLAEEWLSKNPNGYYNSNSDKGVELSEAYDKKIIYAAEYYHPKLYKWIRLCEKPTYEEAAKYLNTPIIDNPKTRVAKYEKSGVRKINYKELPLDETLNEEWNKEWDNLGVDLEKTARKDHINVDFINSDSLVMGSFKLTFAINRGDWKHDHLAFDDIAEEFINNTGKYAFWKVDTIQTEYSDSDNYSADHIVYVVPKDKEALLLDMKKLF